LALAGLRNIISLKLDSPGRLILLEQITNIPQIAFLIFHAVSRASFDTPSGLEVAQGKMLLHARHVLQLNNERFAPDCPRPHAVQPTVQNVLGKKRHHRCFNSVTLIEKVKKFGDDIRCAPT
jgi:hypothetical protein